MKHKVYTAGAISIQRARHFPDLMAITIGIDLECPETEMIGYIHKDYFKDLEAAAKLFNRRCVK